VGIANKSRLSLILMSLAKTPRPRYSRRRQIHARPVQSQHAHRSERGGGGRSGAGGDLDQAPGERSKKALFSARTAFMSKMVILQDYRSPVGVAP